MWRSLSIGAALVVVCPACKTASQQNAPPVDLGPATDAYVAPPDGAVADAPPAGDLGPPRAHKPTLTEVGKANDRSFIEITDVLVSGDRAYVCTGVQGMLVYDIKDPKDMRVLGAARPGFSYPRCQNQALDGKTIFIAGRGDEITPVPYIAAVDLTDERNPRIVDLAESRDASIEGLATRGGLVYAAAHEKGLLVYRYAGRKLIRGAAVTGFTNAWGLAFVGKGHLAIADGAGGLRVADLKDPAKPRIVGRVALSGFARRVVVSGSTAYISMGAAGIAVVDLATPASPKVLSTAATPYTALDVEIEGSRLYVANWTDIRAYDVSDPKRPKLKGAHVLTPRSGFSGFTRNLAVGARGDLIFAGEWAGLRSLRYTPGDIPIILVSRRRVTFPTTKTGTTAARAIKVINEGQALLGVTLSASGSGFSVKPGTLRLAPGKADVVEVRFKPSAAGPASGSVVLTGNDPARPRVTLGLTGNDPGLDVGAPHPDFTLTDRQGKTHQLSKLKGKVVLLAYFATF